MYELFKHDFIEHSPSFRGMRLGLKKHPLHKDKEATFWHITSEGSNEEERLPDMRRLERIKWPAVMINNWTAYLIEYESRKRKLLKEYEAYIKSKER